MKKERKNVIVQEMVDRCNTKCYSDKKVDRCNTVWQQEFWKAEKHCSLHMHNLYFCKMSVTNGCI